MISDHIIATYTVRRGMFSALQCNAAACDVSHPWQRGEHIAMSLRGGAIAAVTRAVAEWGWKGFMLWADSECRGQRKQPGK